MNAEHIAVTGDLLEQLKQRAQCPSPYTPPGATIGSLLGIPVVVDESLSPDPGWELRSKCQRMSVAEMRSTVGIIGKLIGRPHD